MAGHGRHLPVPHPGPHRRPAPGHQEGHPRDRRRDRGQQGRRRPRDRRPGSAARELAARCAWCTARGEWAPPVVTCSGLTGRGVDDIWQRVLAHREHLGDGGPGRQARPPAARLHLGAGPRRARAAAPPLRRTSPRSGTRSRARARAASCPRWPPPTGSSRPTTESTTVAWTPPVAGELICPWTCPAMLRRARSRPWSRSTPTTSSISAATCTPTPSCRGGAPDHRPGRRAPRPGRLAAHPAAGDRALVADLGDAGPRGRAARRPRRPAGRRHHRPTPGRARSPASPTPAATTCTPPPWSAPASRWPRCTSRGLLPGPGPAALPARRGGDARAVPPHLMSLGALDDVDRIFCLHCDPTIDVGQVGLRRGPDHRRRRQPRGPAHGTGGHTSPPAPDRGPHLRPRPRSSPSCPAVLSRRLDPRAGVSVVWGMVARRRAPPT